MINIDALYALREIYENDRIRFRHILSSLDKEEQYQILSHWYFKDLPEKGARFDQIIPWHQDWYIRCYKPGRGWGKNWALSRNAVTAALFFGDKIPKFRINVFALSQSECNDTIILGDSGIANFLEEMGLSIISGTKVDIPDPGHVVYLFSKDHIQLRFSNGSMIRFYSSSKTRGKQSHLTFVDEFFTWYEDESDRQKKLETALEELETITRLGDNPRLIITSTPQPVSVLKRLYARRDSGEKIIIISGKTDDNKALSEDYRARIMARYGNTRRAQQEIYGNETWEMPGALWQPDMIRYLDNLPDNVVKTIVAIDPAATMTKDSDETGIVAVCKTSDGKYILLDDKSGKFSPRDWATAAIELLKKYKGSRIVYESNQGGDMVAETLRSVDRSVPLKAVRASKGKIARAEPIAALYEQGKVYHNKVFTKLEQQLLEYSPENSSKSPDRLDALVWGIHELSTTESVGLSWI